MVLTLYFEKTVKRIQGEMKLFLIKELGSIFLLLVQFNLDFKGQVVFGAENKQQGIPERRKSLPKV